ncbi:MAG: hypothetical protein RIA72_11880 [Sphingopyxis sp.]|jgi:hypothetical protein|uniref:hypothetical protein n=1 Tax=Sphingopyxis sp. TaxID=1908224 RepID=UPI0032ED3E36
MTRIASAVFVFAGLLSASTAQAFAQPEPAKAPSAMTPTEIKAHNEGLLATDPAYIKCRKTLEVGSLVKKNRVCHTNKQWKEVSAKGNQAARDTAEAMTSKAGSSN